MKLFCFFALAACLVFSPSKNRELFDDFHTHFAKRDFVKLDKLLAPNFVNKSTGGSIMTKEAYMEYMSGWNKVFDTKWNVVSVKEKGDLIVSEEYDTDMFNDYFMGGTRHYQYTYTFEGNTIERIDVDTLPGSAAKEAIFQERFFGFVEWVKSRYPQQISYLGRYDKEAAEAVKYMLAEYLKYKK